MAGGKEGGKNRKIGRNKMACERYEREGRLAKNKVKSLAKHLKRMGLPASYQGAYTPPNTMKQEDYRGAGYGFKRPHAWRKAMLMRKETWLKAPSL